MQDARYQEVPVIGGLTVFIGGGDKGSPFSNYNLGLFFASVTDYALIISQSLFTALLYNCKFTGVFP